MNSNPSRHLLKDLSLSAIAAGFVTVLVGFASSAVIVFQAAQSLGASPAEISSWMWALGLGMGLMPWDSAMKLGLDYALELARLALRPIDLTWHVLGIVVALVAGYRRWSMPKQRT